MRPRARTPLKPLSQTLEANELTRSPRISTVHTTSFWTGVIIQSVSIHLLLLRLLDLRWWDGFKLLRLPWF